MATARDGPGGIVLAALSYEAVRRLLDGIDAAGTRPADLERGQGIPRNTLHQHRQDLEALDALERRVTPGPPRLVRYVLRPRGLELRELVRSVAAWLSEGPPPAPRGTEDPGLAAEIPPRLQDPLGKGAWQAIEAIGDGWATGAVRALVDRPLRRSELETALGPLTSARRDGLLRRLRATGVVAPVRGVDGIDRYALTAWGRVGVGKLAALARFERTHLRERCVPITVGDGVDALRAILPLVALSSRDGVTCQFVVRGDADGPGPTMGAAWAELGSGPISLRGSGSAARKVDLFAQGSLDEWMSAVLDRRPEALRISGSRRRLGPPLIRHLHGTLHGQRRRG